MKIKRTVTAILAFVTAFGVLIGCSDKRPSDKDGLANAEPVLVAPQLDPASTEPERSSKTFQDIASFFGTRIEDWQETYRELKVTEKDGTAIAEYVRLLIDEFDYEIVASTNFDLDAEDPFGGKLAKEEFEVLLGLATVDTGRETVGRINSDARGDIRLHGTSKGVVTLVFADLFHTEDFGYRRSGGTGDRFNEVFGQRAADAYYLGNGRYYNGSDGALSVEAGTHGEAAILLNGKEVLYSTKAAVGVERYAAYPCDDYSIGIYDFIDGASEERIEVAIHKSLKGGEVYTLSDALGWLCASPIYVEYCCLGDTGGVSSLTRPTGRSAMNACTVRVLRWDEVECVVYISMDLVYELEPVTLEILAAMPAYGSLQSETFKDEEAITLKVGESLELEYVSSYVFMPNYETYEWRIESGQGVSISGYGDSCTVTAITPGEIIIKCVYSYGKDEPDVLTGIPRNENHTKTKLYYVKVVP